MPKNGVNSPESEIESYEAYLNYLNSSRIYAERALDSLYSRSGPKRSIWYRLALGRAQSTIMSLYKMELRRQDTELLRILDNNSNE